MNKALRARGFTLVELMIVLAIVAILAAVAYPSYRDSVLKGKRAEARAALAELLQQQERYMTQNNTYLAFSNSAGTTNPAAAATTFKVFSGESAVNPSYWLSAVACGGAGMGIANCVQLSATPTQTDAQVGTLTVSSTGIKTCSGTASSSNPKLCWP